MRFSRCRRNSHANSWRAVVIFGFVTAIGIAHSLPTEKAISPATTTEKLVKHPSYVRVLKQGNGNTKPTEAPKETVLAAEESVKTETVTRNDTTTTDNKGPRTITTLSKNLTTEEIRNLIPYLNFDEAPSTQKPSTRLTAAATRAPRTGVFDILTRVFDSIRGVGDSIGRNRGSNRTLLSAFRGTGDNAVAESKVINGTVISGNSSGRSNDANRGPGGLLLRVLQMLQNASVTVENMVMGFVKFFDRSSSRNSIQ